MPLRPPIPLCFLLALLLPPETTIASDSKTPRGAALISIPAGTAHIGCNEKVDKECEDDERPGGPQEIGAFAIDKTEVTVAHYRACVDAGACTSDGLTMPTTGDSEQPELVWTCNWDIPGREQHPINCVDVAMAEAYCKWAGKRLPSAKEWERAARGTDGRRFPWGNEDVAPDPQANLSDVTLLRNEPGGWGLEQYDDGYVSTAPVGSFTRGRSPVGADDMAGNVWEMTTDGDAHRREMRGGSWSYFPHALRTSDKAFTPVKRRNGDTGFRCAR